MGLGVIFPQLVNVCTQDRDKYCHIAQCETLVKHHSKFNLSYLHLWSHKTKSTTGYYVVQYGLNLIALYTLSVLGSLSHCIM